MKVQKLNEDVNYDSFEDFLSEVDATNAKEKYGQLLRDAGLGGRVIDRLLSFGTSFIEKWIKAMKWNEFTEQSNEFMTLLRNSEQLKETPLPLENRNNFIKIYNAYSDNLFENSYFDNRFFNWLVYGATELYSQSDRALRYIFKVYDQLKAEGRSDEEIKSILLTDDNKLNSVETIKTKINDNSNEGRDINKFKDLTNAINNLDGKDLKNFTDILKQNTKFVQAYAQ